MLGDRIKAGRHEKGLSQQEFAERLSVVRQTVSKWEKGLSNPDSDMLLKIAEVLDTTVSALLEKEEADKSKEAHTKDKEPRRLGALEIVLLVLGSPIWLSLLIAAVSVIISLYAVLWSLIVAVWSVFGAFVSCGFGFTVGGIIIALTNNPAAGTALFGGGLFLLGLSIFTFFGSTAATKGAVWLSKLPFVLIKKSSKRGGSDD